jgi:hypothetical protein
MIIFHPSEIPFSVSKLFASRSETPPSRLRLRPSTLRCHLMFETRATASKLDGTDLSTMLSGNRRHKFFHLSTHPFFCVELEFSLTISCPARSGVRTDRLRYYLMDRASAFWRGLKTSDLSTAYRRMGWLGVSFPAVFPC